MRFLSSLILISALASTPALAQQKADDHSGHHSPTAAASTSGDMTDGEVRKVDLEAAKITLKHAEIKSLDMPAMTMVFVVRDKAMLDKLKPGDKVKFRVVNDAGKFTITEMQPTTASRP